MASPTQDVRKLARRLVARAETASGSEHLSVAVQLACERLDRDLARWLGPAGCYALLARAIARERAGHPLLDEFKITEPSHAALDGVPAMVEAHGDQAVAAALTAVLETELSLLGQLIGDDLMTRLVDSATRGQGHDGDRT